jgi:hypothetical protein
MSPRTLLRGLVPFGRAISGRRFSRNNARRPRRQWLAAELLESRCMLSATARLENNISMFDRIPVIHGSQPANPGGSFVGQFFWNGSGFKSFCVEGQQSISPGLHTFATVTSLSTSGLANADLVEQFWRSYGPTTPTGFTSVTDAAAFQLGLWEIISDGGARDLKSGSFRVGDSASPAVALAASWLNGTGTPAPGAGGSVALHVMQHSTVQDQVIWGPLPPPSVSVKVTPTSVTEDGSNTLTYEFTASPAPTAAITVNYRIGGSAKAGSDFTGLPRGATTGTITIPAGSTSATLTIAPTPDTEIEPDETVVITLQNGTGYALGTSVATGTLVNDDLPEVTLAVLPASVMEDGTTNLVYTFTRTGPTTSGLTVKYGITGTADGADYSGATPGTGKTISFAAGSATATLTIDPTPDTVIEDDETVVIALQNGSGYTFDPPRSLATATIIDDDGNVVTISATDDAADEVMAGPELPSTGTFRVSRSGSLANDLLVKVSIGGSATYHAFAVDDYALSTVQSGLTGYFATIPSGQAFVDIVVTPFQDGTNEDTETVTLSIEQYTGYTVGPRGQATVSILDAPDLSAASVAFRIDMDARPATRCWPVDPAERRLPQVPQDTLRTGEPYVFSLADIGTERTAGVSWKVSYDIIQAIGAPGGAVSVTASSGSATGTSFLRTFAIDEERVTTLFGTTTHDRWQVHFFVDANRNGRRDASESVAVGRFNEVLQDRKAIWLCRLEEEKKAHAGTIYNEVFGVTAFFDELIATVKNVSFGRNGDPNALAIYGFMTNTIGVNDAENVEGDIDTIIHESVHALDDARNWPPNAFPTTFQIDTVEAIAWTAQHLLYRKQFLGELRKVEDLLGDPNPHTTALEAQWKTVVRLFHQFTNAREVGRPWPLGPRPITLDDVQTTRAAVGLHFDMANIMVAYQQRLNDAGVAVSLTSGVQIGPDHFSIPDVFLE